MTLEAVGDLADLGCRLVQWWAVDNNINICQIHSSILSNEHPAPTTAGSVSNSYH